ncbi:MAG: hypothetical protein R3D33_12640 [Hyphomicrobiaceae bacterium]
MYRLAIVFTGHMIDLPGRDRPRFPARIEALAEDVIKRVVGARSAACDGDVVGIASGARGGDILFLEICRDLALDTRMVLPEPVEDFIAHSVDGVPSGEWVARFQDLWNAHGAGEREVIGADRSRPAVNIYDACNRRSLELAGELAKEVRLLAYWNGEGGDGAGGTQSFVDLVEAAGGEVDRIDAGELLRRAAEAGI